MSDIGEIFCQSVDTIVSERLNQLSFDKTIICTIIDDTNKDKGQYIVSNNNIKFDAFCENTKYNINDQVCVLIPEGDFSSPQKTILSKYAGDNLNQPIFYTPPFSQLILGEDLILNKKEFGISANNDAEKEIKIYTIENIKDNSLMYTSIGVKALFKTLLQNYRITKGEYGLLISLQGTKANEKYEIKFSSEEMFGNPFGYISYLSQEKKIDISTLNFVISKIDIFLYQSNDFYEENKKIEYKNNNIPNINIKDLEFYFANDITLKIPNSFEILCDNKIYEIGNAKREIKFIWYRVDKNNKYLGFPPDSEYKIEWQRYNQGIWENINLENNIIFLREDLKEEKIKAILIYKNNRYASNILVFINQSFSDNSLDPLKSSSLLIDLGSKADKIYPLYGQDNLLIDATQSLINRELLLSFSSPQLNLTSKKFFSNASSIKWYVPQESTMLECDDKFLQEKGFSASKEEVFKVYSQIQLKKDQALPFYFRIKKLYNSIFTNNFIKCKIKYENIEYVAQINFSFSSYGSNGTNYTPLITVEENDKNNFILNALLYDPNFSKVDLQKENVSWDYLDNESIWKPINGTNQEKIFSLNISQTWDNNKPNIIRANFTFNSIKVACIQSLENINIESLGAGAYISCPTKIIYNNQGAEPSYYQGELKLFNSNNIQVKDSSHLIKNISRNNEQISWSIRYFTDKDITPLKEKNYLPKITKDEEKNTYTFSVPKLLVDDLPPITLIAKIGSNILWQQPIIITQNSLAVSNDEREIIQTNKDYILNVTAGRGKNNNNKFSGLILGDINDSLDKASSTFGLYGYLDNDKFFNLDIRGNFFIGKNQQIKLIDNNLFLGKALIENNTVYFQNINNDKKNYLNTDFTTSNNIFLQITDNNNYFIINKNGTVSAKGIDLKDFSVENSKISKISFSQQTFKCQVNGKDFVDKDNNPVTVTLIAPTEKNIKYLLGGET